MERITRKEGFRYAREVGAQITQGTEHRIEKHELDARRFNLNPHLLGKPDGIEAHTGIHGLEKRFKENRHGSLGI